MTPSSTALAAPVRLYRMGTPDHLCPYGLKAVELLNARAIAFEDHRLVTAEAVEAFKAAARSCGHPADLCRLGSDRRLHRSGQAAGGDARKERRAQLPGRAGGVRYGPAGGPGHGLQGPMGVLDRFMGLALAFLACLKLMDPGAFRTTFRKYDRLTQRWSRYGHAYPWLELLVALGILSRLGALPVGLLAIAMGLEGAFSVIKVVYVDKLDLDLDCACVGGNIRTPLGAVSVLENLMMVVMGTALLPGASG